MKKLVIIAAIAALFSTMASANSGLADRINEARTYPHKTVEQKAMKTCMEQGKTNEKMSGVKLHYSENNSDNISHQHS